MSDAERLVREVRDKMEREIDGESDRPAQDVLDEDYPNFIAFLDAALSAMAHDRAQATKDREFIEAAEALIGDYFDNQGTETRSTVPLWNAAYAAYRARRAKREETDV